MAQRSIRLSDIGAKRVASVMRWKFFQRYTFLSEECIDFSLKVYTEQPWERDLVVSLSFYHREIPGADFSLTGINVFAAPEVYREVFSVTLSAALRVMLRLDAIQLTLVALSSSCSLWIECLLRGGSAGGRTAILQCWPRKSMMPLGSIDSIARHWS